MCSGRRFELDTASDLVGAVEGMKVRARMICLPRVGIRMTVEDGAEIYLYLLRSSAMGWKSMSRHL